MFWWLACNETSVCGGRLCPTSKKRINRLSSDKPAAESFSLASEVNFPLSSLFVVRGK